MRYRALRIVATVYRVIGWIIIVVGVLSSCGSTAFFITARGTMMGGVYTRAPMWGGVIGAVITLIMGLIMTALSGITLLAIAEGIYLFLDIEENTREIARRIKELPGITAPPAATPE